LRNLKITVRSKTLRTCIGTSMTLGRGTSIAEDEKGDLVADSHSIVARWRNYFSQLSTCIGLRMLGTQKYTQQKH